MILALKSDGFPDGLHGAADHHCEGKSRVHGAEVSGHLPVCENGIGVGSHHRGERSDAVNAPVCLYTLVRPPQHVLLQQNLLHLLQQAH